MLINQIDKITCLTFSSPTDHPWKRSLRSSLESVTTKLPVLQSALQPASQKIKTYLWKKGDIDEFEASAMIMVDQFCSRFSSVSPVKVMWKYLKDHLIQIQNDCILSKLTSSKLGQPWINTCIRRLKWWKRKYRRYSQIRSHIAKNCTTAWRKNLDKPAKQPWITTWVIASPDGRRLLVLHHFAMRMESW